MIPITCNAVGDIIALATLVLDIAHALNESRGSPAKYRAFTSELKSLHIVLASVSRVAELTTDTHLREEIVREVDRCGSDVRRTLERVAKLSVLGRDTTADDDVLRVRLKRQWYKLEWRFSYHGSVGTIREELAAATQRLTVYLVISNADGIQNLNASLTNQFNAMTASICTSLMEQFAAVAERDAAMSHIVSGNAAALGQLELASRQPPQAVYGPGLDSSKAAAAALLCLAICTMHDTSRSVHSALLLAALGILMCNMARDGRANPTATKYSKSSSITLHDAMGRRLVLPLEMCETRELFHLTLVHLFSRTPGRWFVDTQRYVIVPEGKADSDDMWDWKSIIQPGAGIEMLIVVHSAADEYRAGDMSCPVCLVRRGLNLWQPCTGCGRELRRGHWIKRLEVSGDSTQGVLTNLEHDVNDWGRFPRTRPRHQNPRPHGKHANPPGGRKLTSDGRVPLDWRAQVHDFTRIWMHVPPRPPILNMPSESFQGHRELHIAITNGHYALVVQLLDGGEDVNVALASGHTALHLASLHGHSRVVELLLDRGATIDAATNDNVTPLACAVACEELEITALLLARGAIVDAPKSLQAVVLHAATSVDNVGIILLLIHLGLDVDTRFDGETALHIAVRSGFDNVVKALVRNGADVHARSARVIYPGPGRVSEDTPLLLAASHGKVELFGLLLASGAMVNNDATFLASAKGEVLSRLFRYAIRGGSRAIVTTILHNTGVDVNTRLEDDETLLFLAIRAGGHEIVDLLLAHGADPNAEDSPPEWAMKPRGPWKALHAAAYDDNVQVVDMLLKHGVDVNARTDCGDTALSLALEHKRDVLLSISWWSAANRFDKVVDLLLSAGAVVDEGSSTLLQEVGSIARRLNQISDVVIPGAWQECLD